MLALNSCTHLETKPLIFSLSSAHRVLACVRACGILLFTTVGYSSFECFQPGCQLSFSSVADFLGKNQSFSLVLLTGCIAVWFLNDENSDCSGAVWTPHLSDQSQDHTDLGTGLNASIRGGEQVQKDPLCDRRGNEDFLRKHRPSKSVKITAPDWADSKY